MNFLEFEAKALLRDAGLPVPPGTVLHEGDPVRIEQPVVVKAQVPIGGRGKRGLVLPAGPADAGDVVATVRARIGKAGWSPAVVLLEHLIESAGECYLAWRIDDVAQDYVLAFSRAGGVDVESDPGAVAELHFSPLAEPGAHDLVPFLAAAGLSGRTLAATCRFAIGALRVFRQADAQLLEVNPLAITPRGDVIALDAKLVVDDNARGRHRDWSRLLSARFASAGLTPAEKRAAEAGLTFVELPGKVAVLSGGAGLGMALLDLLADAGMPAANFVDNSGGSPQWVSELRTELVFERARRDDVEAILLYITVAASSLGRHVRSIMAMLDKNPPPKPLVVGLLCGGAAEREMRFDEARELFAARGYPCARDLREVMQALAALPMRRTEGANEH